MNIVICEDKCEEAEHLEQMIGRYCNENLFTGSVERFASGSELLSAFQPGRYQIIFLDIYMDGLDGMETARRIRESDKDCVIIFTTVSLDHAVMSYAVNAAFYLVKPVAYDDFLLAMERCIEIFERHAQCIEVLSNRAEEKLLLKDIRYIEAFGNYCEIHVSDRVIRCYIQLHKIQHSLNGWFVRCHRSYIINLYYVYDVDNREVVMENRTRIPCSRTFERSVVNAFHSHISSVARNR